MKHFYTYLNFNNADLFTLAWLPDEGKFPTVIFRSPYVDNLQDWDEEQICSLKYEEAQKWLECGYAYVYQHCRGRGKSGGDCIPYINERADGLCLHDWIRQQSFYNGELYLCGESYTAAVHLTVAPYAEDIKGAVINVMDPFRYNGYYRNGFFKVGLHGGWYTGMYKQKTMANKNYDPAMFNMLPLSDYTEKVFGEKDEFFDKALCHPDRDDPYWQSNEAGGDYHKALMNTKVPLLLTTGWYDIFTGGIFDWWNDMSQNTRNNCALAVHPYDHGGRGEGEPILFDNGSLHDICPKYCIKWMDSIRGKCEPPFEKGKVTYYKSFDNSWHCDNFSEGSEAKEIILGKGEVTYRYDPQEKAYKFIGGLSCNFEGNCRQPEIDREDVITLYTPEFTEDTYVKGKMKVKLTVKSDCEDTCFYIRMSLCKNEGDYGIRDDIQQISNFNKCYTPGDEIEISYDLDPHCFVIHKGERLRLDISSAARNLYVKHTNMRGLYSEQTETRVARNTVILDKSIIILPVE